MTYFNEADMCLFKTLTSMSTDNLKTVMVKVLEHYNYKPEIMPQAIMAEGIIPIAIVVHLDTVWSTPPEHYYYDKEQGVIWSPEGLGADDRLGVMMLLRILKKNLRPHIIITCDEETLGEGSTTIAEHKPFADIRYLIELDRQGSKDCVFYECDNPYFIDYIEGFGFQEDLGTYTDIYTICPSWGIAGVNLSIGYYNEHSRCEHVIIEDYMNTYERVMRMLQVPVNEIPTFKHIPLKYRKHYCVICQNIFPISKLISIDKKNSGLYCCNKCLEVFYNYLYTDAEEQNKEEGINSDQNNN